MGGTFRVGFPPLNLNQKQLRKDLPTGKMVTWKKSSKKSSKPKLLVIFCVHRNPSNGQSPNKKTQIQDSEEKSKFLKNIFLFYRNCQKRANLVHQKMLGSFETKFIGIHGVGGSLGSQLQPPEIPWQNQISYLLKSSPKKYEQTQKWQTTSSFHQFSTNLF